MKKKRYNIIPIGIIIFTILLWVYLQHTQQFIFHYREQHQLFLNDYDFLKQTVYSFGGVAQLCAMFLVQFFSEGSWGALISACCASATGVFLWLGLKRFFNPPLFILPISFIPPLLVVSALADTYYSFSAATGMLIISILFYLNSLCKRNLSRCVMLIITVIAAIFFVYQPEGFYEPLLKTPSYCTWPWIALIIVLAIAYITRFLPKVGKLLNAFGGIVISILICLSILHLSSKRIDPDNYKFMELNSYVINNEWDKVIETCNHTTLNNILYLNYLNLALSHKGVLLQQLFYYPQRDVSSLLCEYQKIPDIIQLQSFVYYQMSDVAAAQNMAFSTSVCNRLGSPSALQMLVKTNLAFGAYEVAEKYIAQLEKTWKFNDWAEYYRAMINDKSLIEQDEEIVNLRQSLTNKDHFAIAFGAVADLDYILEVNPNNKAAFDYIVSYLLLSKDNASIRYFVEKYAGTPVLSQVPEVLQEAIYSIAEQEPDYLKSHGVSEEVFKKYDDFYNKYIQSRNARRNPAVDLRREFGHTYWYYLMFNK